MSLYRDQLSKTREKIKEEFSTSFTPPKYSELLKKHQADQTSNAIISVTMNITNLNTNEDYNRIAVALKEIVGVEDITPLQQKKISIAYNQLQTSLEEIVYRLSRMGYRYVNRF
ncbi:hypothetical protein Amet_3433 [Alkaliphilus metalliredigens QYMF]|uniref:Uncharacterized protein n=1 Tax=Alkaliphilus metalliredigens (strain QYMF) TaxID=293826 RepID=A6TTP3_ALKMQ|nr:hypothetical protein [Alkaliphilus metalliredigens]ABR49561.1 hypothetical protein Amet_3433 [Alkaliphilus metalliredigens QYMF]